MRRLHILCDGTPALRDEVMALASSMVTLRGAATLVDAGNEADLQLTIVVGNQYLTNHGERGYMVAAFLDVKVRLLDGLAAATCAEIDRDAEARDFIRVLDNFWNPLLVAYELGAPLATVASRILEPILGEISAIEGMSIESIIGRDLRVVSALPVSENAELLRQIANGERMDQTLQLPKGVLRLNHAIGVTDAEAKENLRELKRQQVPRADVESARTDDELDARLRESLRRIETEIAIINGNLMASSEEVRPDDYRRCAQTTLFDIWESVVNLAQSVEDRAPADRTIGGVTLRHIRLGAIKEGFSLSVEPKNKA
jgi:hypothetical protein